MMYRVTPTKGAAFVVNGGHLLTLVRTGDGSKHAGGTVDVTVHEWLSWPKTTKHVHKLFRTAAHFPVATPSILSPYLVGALLGDGCVLTTPMLIGGKPFLRALAHSAADEWGLRVVPHTKGRAVPAYHLSSSEWRYNKLTQALKEVGVWGCRAGTKFIPDVFKYADFDDRRALLAGLLDTDGSLSTGCYDYISKSPRLAEDVVFVARSLGLAAYQTVCVKRNQTGFKGRYYRVSISGDVRIVPCQMPSKRAKARRQRKDVLRTGFTVTPLPGAAFYGFTLTGDGRYLLDDFTVTHNSGKGEMIVAVSKFLWEELGWRTLVVTPKKGLAHQMYLRVKKYVGTDIAVGLLSDGQRIPGNIVMATAQTLMAAWPREQDSAGGKKLLPADVLVRDIVSKFDVVIGDECHHVSSQSWSNVFMRSQAKCRLGFSGTPLKDGNIADLTLKAVTGPILYEVESKVLIGRGVIATPRIVFICADNASSPPFSTKPRLLWIRGQKIVVRNQGSYADVYRKGVVESVEHNVTVVRSALWLADRGRKVLVICRRKTHWLQLKAAFTASGVSFLSLWGATKISERERAKKCINDGTISILLASTVFDEGEDAPGIDALVLAEGVKVNTNVIQRIGRALRAKKIDNTAWIVDIVPLAGKKLIEHAFERCKLYEREGYEVRLVEEWPAHTTKEDPADMLPFETWV